TTAPPPAQACATRAALKLVRKEGWRREQLQQLVERFRAGAQQLGLRLLDSPTPIQALLTGDAAAALRWSQSLRDQGILISAIRAPTVPPGSERLRITFSANHTEVQVDRLLGALEQASVTEGAVLNNNHRNINRQFPLPSGEGQGEG
ncbi:MAG: aminotransferase class I/II-fold pyridoxal phosphate-dependent enzyme, partial [Gammaproteobacteria bacterium]